MRAPLSPEVRRYAIGRAVEAFLADEPECGVWDAEVCQCGCSVLLRTSCPELDPVVVVGDRVAKGDHIA